jgi:hypothetical protein
MMKPEFYLILDADDLSDELADIVFEAGFDDSSLVMRGGRAAIWICHRDGELTTVVREASKEAQVGGLRVSHVEFETETFTTAQ